MLELNIDKKVITENEDFPGLIKCTFEYKIESQKGSILYNGPKIPKALWEQVVAFMKWTYDTTKSEAQVRLYVNVKEKTWAAWAYPQEMGTGLSSKEIWNDDASEQRKQFNGDWMLFGTVHHHCNISAFQSGTDLHGTGKNDGETNQDGLHITLGNMDNKHSYDFHARFVRRGLTLDPDMTWFWDIGSVLHELPSAIVDLLPDDVEDKIARRQMSAASAVEFPKQWRDNLIKRPEPIPQPHSHQSSLGCLPNSLARSYSSEHIPLWQRSRAAWQDLIEEAKGGMITPDEIKDALESLAEPVVETIVEICLRHRVSPEDMDREIVSDLEGEIKKYDHGKIPKGGLPDPDDELSMYQQ